MNSGLAAESKLCSVISNGSWNWPPARSEDLVEIQALLFDIQPSATEDIVCWTLSASGHYHAGATWDWLREKSAVVLWHKLILFKYYSPRQSFIAWLAILNRLPTKDRMQSWFPSVYLSCVLCCQGESRDHLFFECTYSSLVWEDICNRVWCRIPSRWIDFIHWGQQRLGRSRIWMIKIKLMWCYCVYYLWRERNLRLKMGKYCSARQLIEPIRKELNFKFQSTQLGG